MIVEKEFLNKLRDFGLNTYEAKLWTALLSRGMSTAGELSDIANVPRSRSYDVLESLEKKGFIISKVGKPIRYLAVPPNEVIERVKKKIEDESKKRVNVINQIHSSDLIKELNVLHTQGSNLVEPTDLTGSIKGRENLHDHLRSRIKKAEKSVMIITSEEGAKRKLEALSDVLIKAKQRGVKIRFAAPLKDINQFKELAKIAELKKLGSKARLCVVDGKEITFMLNDDQEVHPASDIGIWINSEFFANAVEKRFDSCFSK
ncbi:TrmB family transcriptional regulator [Nanoarchaeota archaeon]